MSEIITMPKLGFDMKEGTLAAWVKKVGDSINTGDILVEVETDKATVEVEAFVSGTLLKTLVSPGDIVEVGAPIAVIGAAGENPDGAGAPAASAGTATPEENRPVPPPAPGSDRKEPVFQDKDVDAAARKEVPVPAQMDSQASAPGEDGTLPGGIKASPVARRLAEERGIDLRSVQGSGPGGRIVKEDVEGFKPGTAPAAKPAPSAAPAAAPAAATLGTAPTYRVMEDVPHEELALSRLRATIARRMVESKQYVPHFMVTTAMDTTALLDLRKRINASLDDEHKVTVNDMLVKVTALTLRKFPNLNTHWHIDKLIKYSDINIGIAVALPNGGLMNVVARNADQMSLSQMAKHNKDMIQRARDGKVKPDDIEGSTFSVSNLGAYGVEHFTAIINPPEAGILAVGASQQVAVVKNGEITIGNIMKVTISVDHRVSDGAEGAQFMQEFKALVEDPMRMLI